MAEIMLRRTINGLAPMQDLPTAWKVGDSLLCTVRKPRNVKFHRKAFALLAIVHRHADYPSIEALRQSMTIGAGYVDMVINPMNGETSMIPKSWSFSSMDDVEFADLYQSLVNVALKIVPGSTRDDWEQAEYEIAMF
jgi:hypothetical protein